MLTQRSKEMIIAETGMTSQELAEYDFKTANNYQLTYNTRQKVSKIRFPEPAKTWYQKILRNFI